MRNVVELQTMAEVHQGEARAAHQQKPLLGSDPGPYKGAACLPSPYQQENQSHCEGVEPDTWYEVPLS